MKLLHNIITFLLSLVVAFTYFSCKKEIFKSDFRGTVRHFYTKQPISGISATLSHGNGSIWYGSSETVGTTTTDGNGEFLFKLRKVRKDAYYIALINSVGLDSTRDESKYMPAHFYEKIEKNSHLEFYIKPSGYIEIHLSDSSWAVLPVDTFIIESIYAKDTLFRGKVKWKAFWVGPSQLNKFIWYGIKNNVKIYYEEKFVYVPNINYYNSYYGYWINLN